MFTLGRVRVLGQPPVEIPFKVVVTDSRGVPFKDASVYLFSGGRPLYDISTNEAGLAQTPIPPGQGPVDVRVEVAGYVVNRRVDNTDETLFIQVPVCQNGEILTLAEIGLLAASGALAWSGWKYKMQSLKTVSEIVFGAVVFNAIFRSNCRT